MKKLILSALFALVVLLSKVEVSAQTSLPEQNTCQPPAEEILSVIKSVYSASPNTESVLIAGEVRAGATRLWLCERPLTLRLAIAVSGGVLKSASQPYYLIRRSAEDKTKTILEVSLSDIKRGLAKDMKLERGDVIFVSRGCLDGKLLQPTNPEFLPDIPRWRDYPIGVPKKRVAR